MSLPAPTRLVDAYDLVILDLDGVVYLIDRPIPAAVPTINRLHDEGSRFAYVTNNASRRATDVADLLTGMGVNARPEEVLTSAAAAAALLAERLPPGAAVLVVGAPALRDEVAAVGLRPVFEAEPETPAVVQGYGPEVGWMALAEACVAVRGGALWVATNTDRTLPSPRGPLPGNGALVAALRAAVDRDPDIVVGKPDPTLFATAARMAGAQRPLVVGDRLDTDIEGAARAGMDSLLVLTGVTRAVDLLHAPPNHRPTYVAADLSGLLEPAAALAVFPDPGTVDDAGGGWQVTDDGAGLRLMGVGEPLDALRALCRASWSDRPVSAVTPGSDAAALALRELNLAG